jgi:hypothetical protein
MTESAINPETSPYGAWYTQPGGQMYHTEAIASAIDDARKRLIRLRQSPSDEPRADFLKSAVMGLVLAAVQLGGCLIYYLSYQLVTSVTGWRRPLDMTTIYFFAGMAVLLLANSVRLLLMPPTRAAEPMFRSYLFWAIGAGRGWARRLLLKSDTESARQRVVPRFMGPANGLSAPFSFNSDYYFKRYWAHGFGGAWRLFRTVRFRDLHSVAIAPDLTVVQATLVVRARRLWLLFVSQVPIVLSALALLIAIMVMLPGKNLPQEKSGIVLLLSLTLGIGVLLAAVLVVLALIPTGRAQFTVRKILVRVNGQWRVFNGELQGAEEYDVSWLRES